MAIISSTAAKLALKVGELTHGHPLATFPAIEMVLCLMSIFAGEKTVPKDISDPSQFVRVTYDNQEQQYREYREMRRRPLDAIPETTGLFMWKQVLEILGLKEGKPWRTMPSFEEGILKAVNECFDRDTAGAVAGAILGAYWGLNRIPLHWKDQVEKADVIMGLAAELMQACGKPGDPLVILMRARASVAFSLPGQPELETFFTEQIIDIVQNQEEYQSMGIDFPSPFVLHGPPGCGKTYAVEALVEYLGWPCYDINSQSIGGIYIHETGMKISRTFETAIQKAPSVVVIDEMDSFLGHRQGAWDYRIEEANEFLKQIQNAGQKRVLVIGMTNLIEMIDPAFLRKGRFDHVIQMGYPSPQSVRAALEKLLADKPCVEGFSLDTASSGVNRPSSFGYRFHRQGSIAAGSKDGEG